MSSASRAIGHVWRRFVRVAGALAPVVRQCVRRDAEQPGGYRQAPPFEAPDRGKRLLEHLRRDVFGRGPIVGATADVGVDPVDVAVVQLDESSRIGLCRFYQKPVVFGGLRQSKPRISIPVTEETGGKLRRRSLPAGLAGIRRLE